MIGKRVIKEKPVPLAEVLETLEKAKKKGDLEYWQRLTYDYAQKFAELKPSKAKELIKELLKLEKIKEHQAVGIADLLPQTKEDIEIIFVKERTRLEDGDVKNILEIVKKYRE